MNQKQSFKEYLAEIEDPKNTREVNYSLPENPTPEQKIKYKICKEILRYQRINKLTDKEIVDITGLSKSEIENVLYCHIEELDLDQLKICISKLPILFPEVFIERSCYSLCFIPLIQK